MTGEELRLASHDLGEGVYQTEIAVPGVHCAACIRAVETGLIELPGVEHVRLNLSTRRVRVKWRGAVPPLLETLAELGYPGHLFTIEDDRSDPAFGRLVRALAVAGFCAMNIMLLSVSVWSGTDAETRQVFHWISAALALPCLVYSGRIFFTSAWSALRRGRTNMDVPISIGVTLAFVLSLYDTLYNGPHAYFDALTSLLFFLLIGRTLDHMMRERARAAVRGLMRLAPRGATVLRPDGGREYLPVSEIEPGMQILLAAGDRIPVDGVIAEGISDLDCSIATGESAPRHAEPGAAVRAGMLNLTGPLTVVAEAPAERSFIAEMVRLMEAAEEGRGRHRRLADRAAQLYSPVVHTAAFLTFLAWMAATGDWHHAIGVAIAVLIITCPCALGLAIPIVQVVAAGRLFESGIMVKDGSAIERMAEVDAVVFDKTGTLTLGRPRLVNRRTIALGDLEIAAELAAHSNHPLARAIASAVDGGGRTGATLPGLSRISEHPGLGIEAHAGGSRYRLGRAAWALSDDARGEAEGEGTVLSCDGRLIARFVFEDALRPKARQAIDALRHAGLPITLLSGDARAAVADTAAKLGIDATASDLLPAGKVARLEAMATEGAKVLMVGDGLNDAPALATAHVSMAPASAADIGRNAADFVFLHDGLDAVPGALAIARRAHRLVLQNLGLAAIYNIVALPIAMAGYVTPLVAALAMSFSSALVVANALRLRPARAGAEDRPSPHGEVASAALASVE